VHVAALLCRLLPEMGRLLPGGLALMILISR